MSDGHRRESGFALVLVLLVLAVAALLAAPLLAQTVTGRAGVRQAEAHQQAYELAVSGLELVQWHYAEMRQNGMLPSDPQAAMQALVAQANASPHKTHLPGTVELRLESATPPHVVIGSTGTVDTVRPDGGTKPVTAAIRATFRMPVAGSFRGGVYYTTSVNCAGTGSNKGRIQDSQGKDISPQQLTPEMFREQHVALLNQYRVMTPDPITGSQVVNGPYTVAANSQIHGDLIVNGDVLVKSGATVTGRIVARNVTIDKQARNVRLLGGIHANGTISIGQQVEDGVFGALVASGSIDWGQQVEDIEVNGPVSSGGTITFSQQIKEVVIHGPIVSAGSISFGQQIENFQVEGSVVSRRGGIAVAQQVEYLTIQGDVVAALTGAVDMAQQIQHVSISGAVVGATVTWAQQIESVTVGGIAGHTVTVAQQSLIKVGNNFGNLEGGPGSGVNLILDSWEVQ